MKKLLILFIVALSSCQVLKAPDYHKEPILVEKTFSLLLEDQTVFIDLVVIDGNKYLYNRYSGTLTKFKTGN